ncbi:hypothetical protein N9L48_06650, partial [Psychrosphaera sp.]|nr:hypothetical protein [Psychrosphaera sp.]
EIIPLGDIDEDGLPAWWETKFGLDDSNPMDANEDSDGDQLTNLDEFLQGTNPNEQDTDSDGLSDYDEITLYTTSPILQDTDSDGLTDAEEINVHATNPTAEDTDGDNFTDGEELLIYFTDPNDENSKPEATSNYAENFDSGTYPVLWEFVETSDANWVVALDPEDETNFTFKSGDIQDNQTSQTRLSLLTTSGTFSFDAKVDTENCCDKLRVYLNDNAQMTVTPADWTTYSLELERGQNIIRFEYFKDGSVSNGTDAVYIDNILFE